MPTIRNELAQDAAAIEAVTVAAFASAAHSSGTEQFIVRSLRDAGQLEVSLVAEVERQVVGHVAISPVTIGNESGGWYGLGPVSVAPEYQKQGIGTMLIRRALDELRAAGAVGCVVLGDPDYYARFGFRAEPKLVLPGAPAEYFQALSFIGTVPEGDVAYHSSFDATA